MTYTTAGEYDLSGVLGLVVDSIIHFASLLTKGSTSFEYVYYKEFYMHGCTCYVQADVNIINFISDWRR